MNRASERERESKDIDIGKERGEIISKHRTYKIFILRKAYFRCNLFTVKMQWIYHNNIHLFVPVFHQTGVYDLVLPLNDFISQYINGNLKCCFCCCCSYRCRYFFLSHPLLLYDRSVPNTTKSFYVESNTHNSAYHSVKSIYAID